MVYLGGQGVGLGKWPGWLSLCAQLGLGHSQFWQRGVHGWKGRQGRTEQLQQGPTCQLPNHCQPPNRQLPTDRRCVSDFDVRALLYNGNISMVYHAVDKRSGITVALKLYKRAKLTVIERHQVGDRCDKRNECGWPSSPSCSATRWGDVW